MLSSSAFQFKTPSASPSITSFDLDAIPVSNCSLISESLSLDSLSTVSDDSTPPIPPGCMVPLSKILGTGSSSSLSEEGRMITTTIPTPPRLRTILKKNLCIERWSETIKNTCEAPGHTPWGNLGNGKEIEWIPEGSIHPQDAFQAALAKARGRRDASSNPHRKLNAVSDTQDPKRARRTTTHGSSYRKALVFEREITLDTGGEVKRWSLQVPALNMSPDMVDVMLELRRLNSFFKEEPDELPLVNPPSLMISNSHSAMPLSLPSTASLQSSSGPTTLAVRRGKRPLPPLLTKSEVLEVLPYPTAFLGTPTTSKFVNRQHSYSKPSGDFTDMISTLRLQCATLKTHPSPRAAHSDVLEARGESSEGGLVDDEDEWSFARPLLQKYKDQLPFSDPPKDIPVTENAGTNTGIPDITIIGKYNPLDRPRPLVVPSALTTIMRVSSGASAAVSLEKRGSSPEILRPPRSPTPSGSMRSISPSNAPSPRGILKRCKSVRFAESSVVDGDDGALTTDVHCPSPMHTPHSSGSGLQHQKPLKRSPLRSMLTSDICNNQTPNITSLPTSIPEPSSGDTGSLALPPLRAAGRQKPPSNYGKATKPPVSPKSRSPTRASTTTIPASRLTRERPKSQVVPANGSPAPKPKPLSSSHFEARQTIGTSLRSRASTISPGMIEKDKENKEIKLAKPRGRASLSALTYRERFTTDESAYRRGSLGGRDGQTSSRMPVPLRKILTRFK